MKLTKKTGTDSIVGADLTIRDVVKFVEKEQAEEKMKKWKWLVIVGIMVCGCVGCGAQKPEETGAVDIRPVDVIQPESGTDETGTDESGADETGTDESGTGETEADESGTGETETEDVPAESATEEADAAAERETEEKNNSYSDLEQKAADGDTAVFAEKIQAAVADKDMEALADLCAFPLAVNGEAVDDREAFMALGADVVFTEERCAAIGAADVSALEESMAGIVMGDATPNIIFKSVAGGLRITGIN